MRTAREVIEDHLKLSKNGTIDEDLQRNYAEDVLLLTTYGIYRGHDGLRTLKKILDRELPEATFSYQNILIEEEMGFLEWSAQSEKAKVTDGADSYLVRDGRIVAQTIHYTVVSTDAR